MTRWLAWSPAVLLGVGAILTVGIDTQRTLPLRAPLDGVVPVEIAAYRGRDLEMSDAERAVAAPTAYLMRTYEASNTAIPWLSLYVGYYDRQTQGKTIHSPKNCLPGAGWEALQSAPVEIQTPNGVVTVNRYLLQKGREQALVLYWYQGRGRVEANEYRVKWNLLRDAALRRRSDEALVRIVVPVSATPDAAFDVARRVAEVIVPSLAAALPS
jgi:EpsI family protein